LFKFFLLDLGLIISLVIYSIPPPNSKIRKKN
jgi:hypothetical protein